MKRTVLGLGLLGAAVALRVGWGAVDAWLDKVEREEAEHAAKVEDAHEWMRRQLFLEGLWHAIGWAGLFIALILVAVSFGVLLDGGFDSIVSTLKGLK